MMAKVVFASLKRPKKPKKGSVGKKRMVGADGRIKMVQTLDAASTSFGDDLQQVFQRNVSKARRDNKRVLGSVDVAPRKS